MARLLVTSAGMRIVRLLVGNPPQSVVDLVEATGVTRTAVTEQLNELIKAGFVERTAENVGRGRPRHLFTATESALRLLFGSNQRFMAGTLLGAIREEGGTDLLRTIFERAHLQIAEHYRKQISAVEPHERLIELAKLMRDEGVLVEVEQDNGKWTLHERTCPFIDMIDDERVVCEVEAAMMSSVVGTPIKLTSCRLNDCAGCTFELSKQE